MSAEWQPIETAPRDGTEILLWRDGWSFAPLGKWEPRDGDGPNGEEVTFFGWDLGDVYVSGACEEGFIGWEEDIRDGVMPTHWQPRPSCSPQAEAVEGKQP